MAFHLILIGVALFGLMMLYAGVRRLWNRHPITGSLQGLTGLLFVAVAVVSYLILLNLHTYARLTHEEPLAVLSFTKLGQQHFRVEIAYAGGGVQPFELKGDEWQLDAQVLKWNGPATLFGANSLYRFDRLSGRYRQIAQEKSASRTVYDLSDNPGMDAWKTARWLERWVRWIDAVYGSGTYLPMADGARFRVSIGTQGLIARPLNPSAEQAVKRWR